MTINIFLCNCGERVASVDGGWVKLEQDCSGGRTCKKTMSELFAVIDQFASERDKALAELEMLKAELDAPSSLACGAIIEADGATASRADTHGIVAYSGGVIYTGGLPEELEMRVIEALAKPTGIASLLRDLLDWHESSKARLT